LAGQRQPAWRWHARIKGQRVLGQIMAGGERMNVKIDAIPCVSMEQAIACQDVLGEPDFN
jgi:hypothetical protein